MNSHSTQALLGAHTSCGSPDPALSLRVHGPRCRWLCDDQRLAASAALCHLPGPGVMQGKLKSRFFFFRHPQVHVETYDSTVFGSLSPPHAWNLPLQAASELPTVCLAAPLACTPECGQEIKCFTVANVCSLYAAAFGSSTSSRRQELGLYAKAR